MGEEMNQDPYDISNHFDYHESIGMYDITNDSDFVLKLKKLNFYESISSKKRLLDDIAYERYGTELLWWVIMLYNNIVNPLDYSNNLIYLPSLSEIDKLLLDNIERRKR